MLFVVLAKLSAMIKKKWFDIPDIGLDNMIDGYLQENTESKLVTKYLGDLPLWDQTDIAIVSLFKFMYHFRGLIRNLNN